MDTTGAGRGYVFPMPTAFLFPSPPPPTSPLAPYHYYSSPSSSSPASLTLASRHHSWLDITSLPMLVLTILGILTISALLLTYYVFVIRCCLTWHTTSSDSGGRSSLIISLSRRRRGRRSTASGHELPVVHGPAPDEARGLGEHAIRALPAFRYSKAVKNSDDTGGDTSDCAVCLGEFQEEERVRLLPSCLHVFHADCVDTWLQGNANCPLCRAAITATAINGRELPLVEHLPRPDEEVVIQVLALAGTGGEADTQSQQQEADLAASSKNNSHFHGDSSDSSSGSELSAL